MHPMKNETKKRGPIFLIVLGIISVIWLLLRVIPKPSRITYPCQRMAAANTVAFITWLLGTYFSATLLKKARVKLKESKISISAVLIILALLTGITTFLITSFGGDVSAAFKSDPLIFTPADLNQPIGVAKGIYPGRVTWAHDKAAVTFNPDGTNGFWWDDKNTNPTKVADMLTYALKGTSGATNSDDAWDILFRYANIGRGKPDMGYSSGEKIAIKVNLVMGLAGGTDNATCPGPTPQLLNAILTDLVVGMNIPGEMITVYDASARIPDYILNPFKNNTNPELKKVRFVGNPKYVTNDRYLPAEADMNTKIHFADTSVTDVYFVKTLTEADYFINLGNMKGHTMAGVTFLQPLAQLVMVMGLAQKTLTHRVDCINSRRSMIFRMEMWDFSPPVRWGHIITLLIFWDILMFMTRPCFILWMGFTPESNKTSWINLPHLTIIMLPVFSCRRILLRLNLFALIFSGRNRFVR
jgi:hypothetical protein